MSKVINGYKFDETQSHKSGGATWWEADKGNTKYFLKCFDAPKRPSDRVSEAVRKQKNEACDNFSKERKKVLATLRTLVGSGIVAPVEFFEHDRKFYQSTEWKVPVGKSLLEISRFDNTSKEFLLKTATQNLKILHNKGIVHLDIKPDNLPVSVNKTNGKNVCALIDFDSSYFIGNLPAPELTAATFPYVSPEFAAYLTNNSKYGGMKAITGKNDVYALAIVFHEYWTGRKFIYNGSEDKSNGRYMYQAVDADEEIHVANGVPDWLERLLQWMIKRNPNERPTMDEVLECLKDHSKIPGIHDNEDEEEDRLEKERKAREEQKRREEEKRFKEQKERELLEQQKRQEEQKKSFFDHRFKAMGSGYEKGPNFPADAQSFERLPNGNIKILYRDGSKMVYNQIVAVKKGLINKN